jgi:GNAT superfamily N-acetyltransferase
MTEIRELRREDISPIAEAFANIGWNKPASQYERYLSEQTAGKRQVFVAFENGEFAGYLTIVFESKYPPFAEEKIPEINDFNVLPRFRRRRIGTKLMDAAEEFVARRSNVVGIGVGLGADYGAAQMLYVRRGYVPDGRGISWQNRFPKYGEQVTVDDDLNLYLTKTLNAETRTK